MVLEWGMSADSVPIIKKIAEYGIACMWYSVESNSSIFRKLMQSMGGRTTIGYLKDDNHFTLDYDIPDFVIWPRLGIYDQDGRESKFDIIIIRDTQTANCIKEAKNILADGGSVFLWSNNMGIHSDALEGLSGYTKITDTLYRLEV